MKALILAGSGVTVTESLKDLCRDAELVVAADSGVRHATVLGVQPDLIVGDFDSATLADLEPFDTVPREVHPARKDLLDLELALTVAQKRGATEYLIVGALGGRLDQTLAALFISSRLHEQHRVVLHSGHNAAYPLRSGETLTLTLPEGTTFRAERADLSDDDRGQMRRVVGYVHRHLAQRPTKEDVETSRWRYSLMNWGHDPEKK